jgi:SAM-dependent methyltransferase
LGGALRAVTKPDHPRLGREPGRATYPYLPRRLQLPENKRPRGDTLHGMDKSGQDDVINRWNNSAPYWEKHRDAIRQMFAPVSEALIQDAQVTSGSSVLDVATGPGEPALRVAEVVGPQGKVVGIDPIPGMIDASRREATRLSLKNAQFEVAGADSLPFPDNCFDAVISRFGVMFFPAPTAGIREMLRVLKTGGKVALAVWHFADDNPFHCSLSRIVNRFAPEPPLSPDAPDAFRFAHPGKMRSVMTEARVREVSERMFRFSRWRSCRGRRWRGWMAGRSSWRSGTAAQR